MSIPATPYKPARFTEVAVQNRVFVEEHAHGAIKHSHAHLHDDDDKTGEYYGMATPVHAHTHCRACGSDDRLCGHKAHSKDGK